MHTDAKLVCRDINEYRIKYVCILRQYARHLERSHPSKKARRKNVTTSEKKDEDKEQESNCYDVLSSII
jgi:hypothetical protein